MKELKEPTERRNGNRRELGLGEPPYLTEAGWVSIDRRQAECRRCLDALGLPPEPIEEPAVKPR